MKFYAWKIWTALSESTRLALDGGKATRLTARITIRRVDHADGQPPTIALIEYESDQPMTRETLDAL